MASLCLKPNAGAVGHFGIALQGLKGGWFRMDVISNTSTPGDGVLTARRTVMASLGAIAAFHLAYCFDQLSFLIVAYLLCMFLLARVKSTRMAFYLGMFIGLATFAPHLAFFFRIFGRAAIVFWLVGGFWMAAFLLTARAVVGTLGWKVASALIPFIWTGWEYFRSELVPLRFSWLSVGYAFAGSPGHIGLNWFGMYGIGFVFMCLIAAWSRLPPRIRLPTGFVALIGLGALVNLPASPEKAAAPSPSTPFVVGIQLEGPSDADVLRALDKAVATYPQADLIALSEYTFSTSIPPEVLAWCKTNRRYLLAGGSEYRREDKSGNFRNTAYVAGPDGKIVFSQGKSVPIQFFNDGLPADERRVWSSPWGPIGICVCYDLSYRRVTDDFISRGAGAILCPAMDCIAWSLQEHLQNARVAPVRAAEYRIPVFRVGSSGISQLIMPGGSVTASAPYPGQGEMLAGYLPVRAAGGTVPADRIIGPACSAVTAVLILLASLATLRDWIARRRAARGPQAPA